MTIPIELSNQQRKNKMTIPIERQDGIKGTLWIENGSIHRLGGPAIEWSDGREEWYKRGKKVPPFNVAKEKLNEI